MMAVAVLLCAGLTSAGLALSYGPDLPAGAVTILLTGALYFAIALIKRR
jgi:zinc transport system permease protein